ncbi:hypothetical protein ACFLVL_00230 [Chloroflexota bacterium]
MPEVIEVLNPVAVAEGELNKFSLASRTKSLSGKKIGLLWNAKRGGDVALAKVGELIESQFGNVQLIRIDGSIGCKPEVLDFAKKECEVAIGSTGD